MAICSLVKANPLLFLNGRKISTVNFCSSIRSPIVVCASSKFTIPEVKSLANSISRITSTTYKKKMTAVPFNLDEAQQTRSSNPVNTILTYMKGLKIVHVVMVTLSLLGIRMMYCHQSALAFSGGAMGGYSFSSSSSSSSDWGYSTSTNSYDDEWVDEPRPMDGRTILVIIVFLIVIFCWNIYVNTVTIIKLQVGLHVNEQILQKDLNRIAKTTDSSTRRGWRHMSEETINSLLQHEKYWICGSSSLEEIYGNEFAEEYFKKVSNKERMKFSEETLVNLDDMEKESIINKKSNDQFNDTYMVVTIVMAASVISYELDIPTIAHSEDVKKALKELRRISYTRKIQALHVLWAPQRENEVLSLKEFRENYPCLKTFKSVKAQEIGN